MRQDIGKISGNVWPGGKGNLSVAVATDGHFSACDIEAGEPAALW
jgi:hypothetical protein